MKNIFVTFLCLLAISTQANIGTWIGDQKVRIFGNEEEKILRFGTTEDVIFLRLNQLDTLAIDIVTYSDRYTTLVKNSDLTNASLSLLQYINTQSVLLEFLLEEEIEDRELNDQLLSQLRFVTAHFAKSVDSVLKRLGEISMLGPNAIHFVSTPTAIERAYYRLGSDFEAELPYYHQVLNNFELL